MMEKLKLPESWWKERKILDPMDAGFIDGALDVINTGGSLFEYMILRLGGLGALFTPPKYFGQTPGTMMGVHANDMDAPLRTLVRDPGLLLQILPEIKEQLSAWAIETAGLDEQAQYNQGRAVFEIATLFVGVGEIKGILKSGESTFGLTRFLTKVDASSGRFALRVSQAGADIETIESGIKLLSKNGDLLATYSDNVWKPAKWIDQSTSVVIDRVDNLAHISSSGARVVGALEVVRNGDEIGVRALRGVSGAGSLPSLIRQLVVKPSYKPFRTIWSKQDKTTTFIGKWDEVINGQQNGLQKVYGELSQSDLNIYMQSGKFDHIGGFNMLSIDNFSAKQAEYAQKLSSGQINSAWKFDDYIWETYNKPWLESALQRGDDIIIWSDPINSRTGYYKRELDFIQSKSTQYGYDYNAGISSGTFSK